MVISILIVSQDNIFITIRTETIGDIVIKKEFIKKMEAVDPEKLKGEEYWDDNPQSTRYFWQPNGYGLKKAEGYYQNVQGWSLYFYLMDLQPLCGLQVKFRFRFRKTNLIWE